VLAEQELLEKPGGMGAVPFRRACVRYRLNLLILRGQRAGAALGFVSYRKERFRQVVGVASGIGE
jgi:hypothetical protein